MVKFLKAVGVGVVILALAFGVFAFVYSTNEWFRARVRYAVLNASVPIGAPPGDGGDIPCLVFTTQAPGTSNRFNRRTD